MGPPKKQKRGVIYYDFFPSYLLSLAVITVVVMGHVGLTGVQTAALVFAEDVPQVVVLPLLATVLNRLCSPRCYTVLTSAYNLCFWALGFTWYALKGMGLE